MSDATSKAAQSATWRKECAKCHKKKIASSFNMNSKQPDGLQRWCKECTKKSEQQRRKIYKDFATEYPDHTLMSVSEYSQFVQRSQKWVKERCESGDLWAINVSTGTNAQWRIVIPPENPNHISETNEPEVAAGSTGAGGLLAGSDVETLARLGGKIARLEGMSDMANDVMEGMENFHKELQVFFDEVKALIAAG